MRIFFVNFVVLACLAGCGGGGGAVSESSGATTFALTGHLLITQGTASRDYTQSANPQDIQLKVNGNPVTVPGVLVIGDALAAGDPATILLPGTKFIGGHLRGQTATLLVGNGRASLPLDSEGVLAQPVALFNSAGTITVPVDAIGPFTFPNGITVVNLISPDLLGGSMDLTCTLNISQTGDITGSGSLTFTEAANGDVRINFNGSSSSSALVRIQSSAAGRSPVALGVIGSAGLRNYSFTSASITYSSNGS